MNQKLLSILPILPLVATLSAAAQSNSLAPRAPVQPDSVVETSRISRFLAGPEARPQGFLLRNGTFVTLAPGLAAQMPAVLEKNVTIRVAGDELSYGGNKTIEAHSVTIAGVSYIDASPASVAVPAPPGRASTPAAPPPPLPHRPRAGFGGPIAPQPHPPCGSVAPSPAPPEGVAAPPAAAPAPPPQN